MEKTVIKYGDIENQKQKFPQNEEPISIKITDINKIVVSNKVSLLKKDLNLLLARKILKKLDLYVYISPKMSPYRKDFDETK